MDRRHFIKNGLSGLSVILVGSACSKKVKDSFQRQSPQQVIQVETLKFSITSAIKEMVTHNEINDARCFFWIYKEERFPADCPGPIVVVTEGERIRVTVTNHLDEPHAFFIKGAVESGPIAPGETVQLSFNAPKAGTYLYYDNLNEPVNRVMGLHGALIVMPRNLQKHSTPYSDPTREVQNIFDDLGDPVGFPGLAWGEGDPSTNTPAFRQHVWLLHEASPVLFAEVGNLPPGQIYPADKFVEAFTQDPYANTFETKKFNRKPHFFTINGQSGHFAHHNPWTSPFRRVGEPVVIRVLNAGIWTHSLHYHGNHFAVIGVDNVASDNLLLVDTFHTDPLIGFDFLYTFRRPPDIPNVGGRGFSSDPPMIGLNGKPVWPPVEEMKIMFRLRHRNGRLKVGMSPLCYPMHDHIETTNTSQGANYPIGMVAAAFYTGDRNTPGFMNFPNYPFQNDIAETGNTREASPPIPDHLEGHLGGSQGGGHDQGQQEQDGAGSEGEETSEGQEDGNSGPGGGHGGHGGEHGGGHHATTANVTQ